MIDANNEANERVKSDLAERRYQRGRDGVIFDDAPVIRKRYESVTTPTTAVDADTVKTMIDANADLLIDGVTWFMQERFNEVVGPLIERIKSLENIIEIRSATWLTGIRGNRQ